MGFGAREKEAVNENPLNCAAALNWPSDFSVTIAISDHQEHRMTEPGEIEGCKRNMTELQLLEILPGPENPVNTKTLSAQFAARSGVSMDHEELKKALENLLAEGSVHRHSEAEACLARVAAKKAMNSKEIKAEKEREGEGEGAEAERKEHIDKMPFTQVPAWYWWSRVPNPYLSELPARAEGKTYADVLAWRQLRSAKELLQSLVAGALVMARTQADLGHTGITHAEFIAHFGDHRGMKRIEQDTLLRLAWRIQLRSYGFRMASSDASAADCGFSWGTSLTPELGGSQTPRWAFQKQGSFRGLPFIAKVKLREC